METTEDDLFDALDEYGNGDTLIAMIAYLDESGLHAQAEVITISGVVARAKDWRRLQRNWPKATAGFRLPYHHSDVLAQQKRHRNAGDDQGVKEYDDLQVRVIDTLSDLEYFGFGASLIRSDWESFRGRIRKTERYQDPWFHVFETAIQEIMSRTQEEFGITDRISFVFDRQDEFKERALALYSKILAIDPKEISYISRLGGLTFESKERIYPLQAADLFTYEGNRYVRETVIKKTEAERWQWERIHKARPRRAINGRIWQKDTLELLAKEIEADDASRTADQPR